MACSSYAEHIQTLTDNLLIQEKYRINKREKNTGHEGLIMSRMEPTCFTEKKNTFILLRKSKRNLTTAQILTRIL